METLLSCTEEKQTDVLCIKTWVFKTSFFLYINYAAITDLTFSVKGKSTFSACSELFNSSYS